MTLNEQEVEVRDHGGWPKGKDRVEEASYETVHARLFYRRGRASEQKCANCGGQAHDWAYDHTDPDEKHDDRGRPYSEDLSRYQPLCMKCHREADSTGGCRRGHPWTESNTYINKAGARFCRTCRREYMREYMREYKRRNRTGVENG